MERLKATVAEVAAEIELRPVLAIWMLVSVIIALSGPFNTYGALSFGARLAYWAFVIGLSVMAAFGFRVAWRMLRKRKGDAAEDLLVVLALALAVGPFTAVLNPVIWPQEGPRVGWHTISLFAFLIGLAATIVRRAIQQELAGNPDRRDRLLDRIDAPDGARLGRVSSDNHHIRIRLVSGEEYRILMRLRDAVADIDREPGFCVHRSHWVALSQIEGVAEANGREVVKLVCGTELPVGPKYRPNLAKIQPVSDEDRPTGAPAERAFPSE
ncbi:LytTR family DNA-binding domain-containing protein [Thalassorhabdomicrobium marinisediminis]|uniref:LytTR family DNA-binding domain-containing protein n=1 Tax=Thalassorhabdomicrobium marinisediminis TaxID=2170577 RepID=UPI0024934C17|nr:LytTR family DNA-binding domain-containing protein [Thalassorhabdomicrobium marinisediminis]